MKKSELFFALLLVPVDFAMIVAAAILAYWFRFTPNVIEIKPVLFDFPFNAYLKVVLLVAPFFLIIFALEGFILFNRPVTFWKEFFKIVFSVTVGSHSCDSGNFSSAGMVFFAIRDSDRLVALAIIFITISRYAINFIQKILLVYKGIWRSSTCSHWKGKFLRHRLPGIQIQSGLRIQNYGHGKQIDH